MKEHVYIMSSWLSSCIKGLEQAGRNIENIVVLADLDRDFLSAPYAQAKDVRAFFNAAQTLYGPSVGIESRFGMVPSSFDCLSMAMLVARDMNHAIELIVRHGACLTNAIEFIFDRQAQQSFFGFRAKQDGTVHPMVIDSILATKVRAYRFLRPNDQAVTAIDFAREKPVDHQHYENYFKVPIHWDALRNGVHLNPEYLAIPSINSSPKLLEQNELRFIDLLTEIEESGFMFAFKTQIQDALQKDDANIQQVATSLNLSVRSLQRRLFEEDTNFQQQLDNARQKEAKRYITTTNLPIVEVAHRLGFSDSGNFSRAFKRWLACSPAQYRRQQNQSNPQP